MAKRRADEVEPLDRLFEALDTWIRRIAARHPLLGQLLSVTVDAPLVFQAFRRFDRSESERSNLFHRLIRNAIRAGDGERAARLMTEHIDQGRDVLLEGFDRVGSVTGLFDAAPGGPPL